MINETINFHDDFPQRKIFFFQVLRHVYLSFIMCYFHRLIGRHTQRRYHVGFEICDPSKPFEALVMRTKRIEETQCNPSFKFLCVP